MKKNIMIVIGLVIIGLVGSAEMARAAGIKERMLNRLPVIEDLKARGIVGENNQGFLEFRPGKSEKKEVVAAENQDRLIVYEAIAKKQGTTVELVGRRRALQIAERAKPGEWLQDASGTWYRK